MTRRFVGGALAGATLAAGAYASAGEFLLVTTGYAPTGCAAMSYQTEKFHSEQEARKAARRFIAEADLDQKRIEVFKPGEVVAVYRYNIGKGPAGTCGLVRYATAAGADLDAVDRKLMDARPASMVGKPEIVETWGAMAPAVVRHEYNGVQVNFELRKGRGQRLHLQVRAYNPHRNKKALLFFFRNGGLVRTLHEIDPASAATIPLGWNAGKFSAAVELVEPGAKTVPLSDRIIDAIQQRIGDEILIKDGKLESSGIGVRG